MPGVRYTAEEDSLLRTLLAEGMTVPQIAARLSRSVYSVRAHVDTLGLRTRIGRSRRHMSMPIVSRIRSMTEDMGLPSVIIGVLIDRSKHMVDNVRIQRGFHVPPLSHRMSVSVTDGCHRALRSAGERHNLMPATIARSCLELLVRDRAEAARAVVAPPPVQIAPGELKALAGLQPVLMARM
jgi:hypothetical protein